MEQSQTINSTEKQTINDNTQSRVSTFLNKIKNSKLLSKLDISYTSALLSLAIIAVMLLILFEPVTYAKSVTNGISLFFKAVFPGLMPFMFLTKLLTSLQTMPKFANSLAPLSQKLFGINGHGMYAFLMSIISGYPIGSKITADLYSQGKIPKEQLLKVALFSSTSGPIFVIGAVGGEFLNSTRLGTIIFVSNLLACIMTAFVISRPKKTKNDQQNTLKISEQDLQKGLSFISKLKQSFSSFFSKHKRGKTTIERVIEQKENNAQALAQSPTTLSSNAIQESLDNNQDIQPSTNNTNAFNTDKNTLPLSTKTNPVQSPQINYVTNKKANQKNKRKEKNTLSIDLSTIIKDCIISLLIVAFYITIFALFIDLLTNLKVIDFLSKMLNPIFSVLKIDSAFETGTMSGIIEMTRGAKVLSSTLSIKSVSLISFIISFSGISIIMQSLTFLSSTPIKKGRFIFGKLLQACFSYFICFILLHIF